MKRFVSLVVLLVAAATVFSQGLYWQTKTIGTVGEHVSDGFAVPKKMKIVNQGTATVPGDITIFRLDREVMWQINPSKKTYSEISFAQMEAMMKNASSKMDAAMAKMQEELSKLPPDQRKMVEEMMKGRMPGARGKADAPIQVSSTGERKTISGFACTKFAVQHGEKTVATLWVTKDVPGFAELAEDWKAFSKRLASMMPRFASEMAEAYKKIQGFTIQSEIPDLGVVTTVLKVERRSTPASEFEIPAGYTKEKSDLEHQLQEMDQEDQ
ncbi:MAG: hypothetical protein C4326_05070 [Ignavibacteria bacterium]